MDKAIPSQHHPAGVLRSHYRAVRALLAVAMIVVVGVTAALVIVANDDDTGTTSASPTGQITYGDFNPATGRPDSAPLPQRDAQAPSGTTRYDGGPEEGSRGIGLSTAVPEVHVNPSTGYPSTLYDGSPK
jgi:hypothetical protein